MKSTSTFYRHHQNSNMSSSAQTGFAPQARPQNNRGTGRRGASRGRGGANRGANRGRGGGRQSNNANQAPQKVAEPAPETPQEPEKDAVVQAVEPVEPSESGEEVCWICAEPVKYYSISECNHRTCHVCALRLRALYKRNDCTFCKVRTEIVICWCVELWTMCLNRKTKLL